MNVTLQFNNCNNLKRNCLNLLNKSRYLLEKMVFWKIYLIDKSKQTEIVIPSRPLIESVSVLKWNSGVQRKTSLTTSNLSSVRRGRGTFCRFVIRFFRLKETGQTEKGTYWFNKALVNYELFNDPQPKMEKTMNRSSCWQVYVNIVFFASTLIVRTTLKLPEGVHATLINIT